MPKKWYYPGENSKNHFFLLLSKKWSRMGSKLFFLESKNHFSGLYKKIMIKNPLIASKKILQKKWYYPGEMTLPCNIFESGLNTKNLEAVLKTRFVKASCSRFS